MGEGESERTWLKKMEEKGSKQSREIIINNSNYMVFYSRQVEMRILNNLYILESVLMRLFPFLHFDLPPGTFILFIELNESNGWSLISMWICSLVILAFR